jgi:hypothetical protein
MLVGAYKSNTVSSGGAYRTIAEKSQHPGYNDNTSANDFLLLRLNKAVTSVAPVQLLINENGSIPRTNDALTVIGLGAITQGGNGPIDKILREVVVQAISTSQCNAQYGSGSIKNSMFCACKESNVDVFLQTKSMLCSNAR